LATLGGVTQIGSIRFPELGQGKWGRLFRVAISLIFLHLNFANVNMALRLMYISKACWQKHWQQQQMTDRLSTCLGHLGWYNTDKIISISVTWLREVSKSIWHCDIADVFAFKSKYGFKAHSHY
jgi:hypothetical protein